MFELNGSSNMGGGEVPDDQVSFITLDEKAM